jgi:hypothetical protein
MAAELLARRRSRPAITAEYSLILTVFAVLEQIYEFIEKTNPRNPPGIVSERR